MHAPHKSIIGVNENHLCKRCKRSLPWDQFRPLKRSWQLQPAKVMLLHPYCYKCREQLRGIWVKHPLYSTELDAFMGRELSKVRSRAPKALLEKDDILGLYIAQNGRCALSGLEMLPENGSGAQNNMKASLDRIDSSDCYRPGNVQWVCWVVNRMKADLPQHRFVDFCKHVAAKSDEQDSTLLKAIGE